jgi:hypothetical protein
MRSHNFTTTLRKIRETDGFPGEVSEALRAEIVPEYATVEISPHTGMILQWKLTKKGAGELRKANSSARFMEKWRKNNARRYSQPEPKAIRPLTVEVLDALKSILQDGHPNTEKLDILSRIQRAGGGGFYQKMWVADGPWAIFKDGKWELTKIGHAAAIAHVRKSECAQFGGKVR